MLLKSHSITGFASNRTKSHEFISEMSERNRMTTRLLASSKNYDPSQSPITIQSLSDPVWRTFNNEEMSERNRMTTRLLASSNNYDPSQSPVTIQSLSDPVWRTFNNEEMSERNRMTTRLLASSKNYDPSQSPVTIQSLSDPVWRTFNNEEMSERNRMTTRLLASSKNYDPSQSPVTIQSLSDPVWRTFNNEEMSERNRMTTRLLASSNNYDPSQSPVTIRSLSDPVWKTNNEEKTVHDDGWIGDYSLLKTFYTKDSATSVLDRVSSESSSVTLCNEGDGLREAINAADSDIVAMFTKGMKAASQSSQQSSAAKSQQRDSFESSKPNCVSLKDAFANFYFSDDRSLGEPKKSLQRPQTAVFNGTTPIYSKASSSRQLRHKRDDRSLNREVNKTSPIKPVQIDVTASQFPVPPSSSVQLQSPGDAASVSDSYNQYLKWKILFAAAENNHSYVYTQIDNPVVQQLAAIIATNPYVYNLLMVYLWQQNLAIQRHKTILMQILQKEKQQQQTKNPKKQTHQRNARRRNRSSLLKDQRDDRLNNYPKQRLS